MEKVELDFGAFGTVYYDADGRVLGSMQYGPARCVPARARAAGRAAVRRRDPRHLRLPRRRVEPVGAAVALPRRDRRGARPRRARARGVLVPLPRGRVGVRALPACTRRSSRRTSSPTSGSRSCAPPGRVGLSRLELGGLQPVVEGKREKVLRVVKDAFGVPEPVPTPAAVLTLVGDRPVSTSASAPLNRAHELRTVERRAPSSVSSPWPPRIGSPPISRIERHARAPRAARGRRVPRPTEGGGSSPAAACRRRARG